MGGHNYVVGHFAVTMGSYDGLLNPGLVKIAEVTDKLVKSLRFGRMAHTPKTSVIAVFETQEEAERLINTLAGIRGEKNRRIQAASAAAVEQARAAIAAALSRQENPNG